MASSVIVSALVNLARVDLQYDDVFPIEDLHDFTQAPTGSLKKITVANLFTNVTIVGTVSASGAVTLASTLSVTGVVTLLSSATVAGSLGVASDLNITNGTARNYTLRSNGAGELAFIDSTAVATRWKIVASGSLTPEAGNAYDLGASGTRVATGYFVALNTTGNATIGGTLTVTGSTTLGVANIVSVAAGASGITSTGGLTVSAGATALLTTSITGTLGVSGAIAGFLDVATASSAAGRICKTGNNGTVIQGASGSFTDIAMLDHSGNALAVGRASDSSFQVVKLLGMSAAPSVAAGAQAGSGATVAISGTDLAGKVTVTVGTGAASGAYATVTFSNAYVAAPYVTLTGVALNQTVWVSGIGMSSFTINIGAALTGASSAVINYVVHG